MSEIPTLKRLDEPAAETTSRGTTVRPRGTRDATHNGDGESLGTTLLKGLLAVGAATLATAVGNTVARYWWMKYERGEARVPGVPRHPGTPPSPPPPLRRTSTPPPLVHPSSGE